MIEAGVKQERKRVDSMTDAQLLAEAIAEAEIIASAHSKDHLTASHNTPMWL